MPWPRVGWGVSLQVRKGATKGNQTWRVRVPGDVRGNDGEVREQGSPGGGRPGGWRRCGAGRGRGGCRQQTGKRSDQPARLVEGQRVMGWREALNELDCAYPGRLR